MPGIVSDIVDVYVFRRLNARVQFLLLQRRHDVAMAMTWQGFHAQIEPNENTLDAAKRAVREMVGLNVSAFYSADYVNQFYDDYRDVLVLAPVVAAVIVNSLGGYTTLYVTAALVGLAGALAVVRIRGVR